MVVRTRPRDLRRALLAAAEERRLETWLRALAGADYDSALSAWQRYLRDCPPSRASVEDFQIRWLHGEYGAGIAWAFRIGGGHRCQVYARSEDAARERIYRRYPQARGQRVKVWPANEVEPA